MHPDIPMPTTSLPSFHYSVTKAAINAMTHFMAGCVGMLRHPRQRDRAGPDA